MNKFEFKVVSAPVKAQKFSNLGPGEDAYNQTVANMMNELGSNGWEFVGAEKLPEPRKLFRGRSAQRNVLVFRRAIVPLETSETARANAVSDNVMLLKNEENVRPRRIRKIKSPPFVRHSETFVSLPPDKLKA